MQFTLSDLDQDERDMPSTKEIVDVMNSKALMTWGLVHLSARYQAEYYSLKMLCQVVAHFGDRMQENGTVTFVNMGKEVPGWTQFFESDYPGVNQKQYERAAEAFRAKRSSS